MNKDSAALEEQEVVSLKARQQKEIRALKVMLELKVKELVKRTSVQKKFQQLTSSLAT
jgi:hypothetical protein